MSGDGKIDYEALMQDAMRTVVRNVLHRAAKAGLPGEHHFYISFDTTMPGVHLSKRLREKYPEEMTVVLQHRFWDLLVNDERFEVKLSFDGTPERLVVPFASVRVFYDPSVRFGLQFESMDADELDDPLADGPSMAPGGFAAGRRTRLPGRPDDKPRSIGDRKPRAPRKSKTEHPVLTEVTTPAHEPPTPITTPQRRRGDSNRGDAERLQPAEKRDASDETPTPEQSVAPGSTDAGETAANDKPSSPPEGGAQIVRLDQFRKK